MSETQRFALSVCAEFFIKSGTILSGALAQQAGSSVVKGDAVINTVTWPHPLVWILALVVGIVAGWTEVKAYLHAQPHPPAQEPTA